MNELWIEHSHTGASDTREDILSHGTEPSIISCLDTVGLFETSWMIYKHLDNDSLYDYGKCNK